MGLTVATTVYFPLCFSKVDVKSLKDENELIAFLL